MVSARVKEGPEMAPLTQDELDHLWEDRLALPSELTPAEIYDVFERMKTPPPAEYGEAIERAQSPYCGCCEQEEH